MVLRIHLALSYAFWVKSISISQYFVKCKCEFFVFTIILSIAVKLTEFAQEKGM